MAGGISFSGIALTITGGAQVHFRLAYQPRNCYLLPVNGLTTFKPPLCKGRWHFHKKMTVGLLLTPPFAFCYFLSHSQSLSLAVARQLPLHKGAFGTKTSSANFLFVFCSPAIAFFEPRDYRVVFVIQATEEA